MTLKELQNFHGYSTDKESTHHYLDTYDRLFIPFQDKKINLVEVGYATGGSIDLWHEYFTKANIVVIDIDFGDELNRFDERVTFLESDINEVCDFFFDNDLTIDIAIDDGSHVTKDQIAFINLVWPSMNKGGLLIIEDVFDIENSKKDFDVLNIPYEIVDLRKETGVSDSVLLIFRK